jgi:hypothetical protein
MADLIYFFFPGKASSRKRERTPNRLRAKRLADKAQHCSLRAGKTPSDKSPQLPLANGVGISNG